MSDTRSRDPASDRDIDDDSRRSPVHDPIGTSDRHSSSDISVRKRETEESIPQLLRRLADQGSHLAQQQAELVQAEVQSSVNELKQAAGAMAGAAVVGIAGLGVLLMAIAFLLGEVMDLWLATLIVAVATLAGAYAMFSAGQKKLQNGTFSVDRTRRTIERAPSAISGHSDEGLNNGR